jgi:S-methylmethionine-dependent homocysteine/selenocysteine methylase
MLNTMLTPGTERHPALVIDKAIYLPVYDRPKTVKGWVGPCGNRYSSEYLASQGARVEMLELWPRQWVKELIRGFTGINSNATIGEIRKAYEKALGII